MTEPRDDFERRLEAEVGSYLAASAPRLEARQAAERAMSARTHRSQSLATAVGAAFAVVGALAVGLAILLIRAPSPPVGASPSPSAPPAPTAASVILPADAPLKPIECGWPASTPLAFAGWATVTDLSAQKIVQGNPLAHVYALVTRDRVERHPMIGSPMLERGFCALQQDGAQVESGVPYDWASHGATPSPLVTCEGGIVDCARETLVVLDAVSDFGHPAVRITFRADATCIWFPFGGAHPCPAIAVPDSAQRVTNAVVSFAGIAQQAFLNLFWLADGSISPDMAHVAPPPGATPFP